jgi:putative transposase
MTKTSVIDFAKPSDFSPDPLTDILRQGARELLATAVRAEVSEFMGGHADLLDDEGRQRLVRHGFLPECEVLTIARQAIA